MACLLYVMITNRLLGNCSVCSSPTVGAPLSIPIILKHPSLYATQRFTCVYRHIIEVNLLKTESCFHLNLISINKFFNSVY